MKVNKMTNQLLVCISASWDMDVNCPRNNIEEKKTDDLQVWKNTLLLVGFSFFQIGWSWESLGWAQI